MGTPARMTVPVIAGGVALLGILWLFWPLSFQAVSGALVAAVAAMGAYYWYWAQRGIVRPTQALIGHVALPSDALPEVAHIAHRIADLEQRLQAEHDEHVLLAASHEKATHTLEKLEQERALDATWEWNAADDSMCFSESWKALLGFSPNEFSDTFSAWKNRIHPMDVAGVESAFRACVQGDRSSLEVEYRIAHRDMSPRWMLSHAVRDETGGATRLIGKDIDVTPFKRMENVLRQVTDGTASTTGPAYFKELVRHIALTLGVRQVVLTRCQNYPVTTLKTVAFWSDGGFAPDLEYDIAGTPCEEVVRHGVDRFHANALRQAYPADQSLTADSYYGVPVLNAEGVVLGHLAVMQSGPLDESVRRSGIFHMFAARAGAEMARTHVDSTVAKLITELESLPSDERLRHIAKYFAELIGVREAIVTQCVFEPQTKLRVLAWWRDGRFESTTEYNLVGTTCEETINEGRICIYPDGVGVRFPPARPFERESYVGVPCFGGGNTVIGHLAAFHNKALPKRIPDSSTLSLFADRAAVELRHANTLQ